MKNNLPAESRAARALPLLSFASSHLFDGVQQQPEVHRGPPFLDSNKR
jgi:hypothetical protein